jgi:hypothetical protein
MIWKKRVKNESNACADTVVPDSLHDMSNTIAGELIPEMMSEFLRQTARTTIQEQLAGEFGDELKKSYEAIFSEPWFKNRLLIGAIDSVIAAQCQYIAQTFMEESPTLDEQTTTTLKTLLERFPDQWDWRSLAQVAGLSIGGVVENIILEHQLGRPEEDSSS